MNSIKALFFDVDGTLLSFRIHAIPSSAVNAIAQAHEQGVKIIIATGRARSIINNLDAIAPYIDGYITNNGAQAFLGDELVYCLPMPEADVQAMLRYVDEHDIACMVVGQTKHTFYRANKLSHEIFAHQLGVQNLCENAPLAPVMEQPIVQLTPIITQAQQDEIMPQMPGSISLRWRPEFSDMTAKGATKGYGVVAIAKRLGITVEQTMAFGDGENDIPMIRQAGIGVAMGQANPALKAAADFVTTDVDDDGIRNALVHYHVITD